MAGSFVGQRGPREQMRIGGCKKRGSRRKEGHERGGERGCSRKRNAIFAHVPPSFVFDASFPQGN